MLLLWFMLTERFSGSVEFIRIFVLIFSRYVSDSSTVCLVLKFLWAYGCIPFSYCDPFLLTNMS